MASNLMRLALGKEPNLCWSVRRIATYAREWREKEDAGIRRDPEIRHPRPDRSAILYPQRPSADVSTITFMNAYAGLKPQFLSPRADPSFQIRQFSTTNQNAGSGGGKGDGSGSGKGGKATIHPAIQPFLLFILVLYLPLALGLVGQPGGDVHCPPNCPYNKRSSEKPS